MCNIIEKLSNSSKEEIWNNFYKCFPLVKDNEGVAIKLPDDILTALSGILDKSQIKEWLNLEVALLENYKPVDLLKTEEGTKALKMFILSMPN
ncbi:hypothetical protein [Paenibacillus harenae]|uniref:Antitoxin Xre/MbcA/ParS-like toxin-binding domain-containing protein n=1 Tax=Paenibacillus harenae TaxID=306543 RepID=A0ABT9TTI5_PAEHA|nr:hypothetical protein [Paenibacillus harenae]MDQ0110647.1 hypothetical protein [Paenibacillus harenae]